MQTFFPAAETPVSVPYTVLPGGGELASTEATRATQRRNNNANAPARDPDVLTLVLQGSVLMTNPAMPQIAVVPLDA